MSSGHRILLSLTLFLTVLAFGTAGYVLFEDHSIVEGLYMSIITISTVGFGEIRPLSEFGRAFTMLLIIVGFITLAFAGHTLAESLLEKVWSGKSRLKKMKKRISLLEKHFIICGFGRMGEAASKYLLEAKSDFVILETDAARCAEIQEKGFPHLEGDATRESLLLHSGIKTASGLIALLNSDPENLFIVLTARELNPTLHIISRAENASSEKKLLRAGADSVISPLATAGKRVAEDILAATGRKEFTLHHDSSHHVSPCWLTVSDHPDLYNHSIRSSEENLNAQILGLHRDGKDEIFPDQNTVLKTEDKILILKGLSNPRSTTQSFETEVQKLVIVDDNPVILSLYNRLFRKAGFHPLTAANGREGLNLILSEKPAVAVIDFMLPILSGVEVCRKVRVDPANRDIKLILFTADDQSETKRRALNAGADAVVVKSPNASEVVETVLKIMKNSSRPEKSAP
jgi:voltage-gated potassium channel